MKRNTNLPELLAPAGSRKAFEAAILSGADAVYFGGLDFNARANADNFNDEGIKSAIADAHSAGVKVYVTLNTLIFDREIKHFLKAAETAYYSGADAIITADLGCASVLRRFFPDLPLHASTQMSVHNTNASKHLAEFGFSRVVLARELKRSDIQSFINESPLETEVFVHGALCVCHSGQCLFSSLVGGRSGNRGECAQPCRLPYDNKSSNRFPLSLKDLCLAKHVTSLIKDGVASLKIEGRMKPADYVGAVTSVWRRLLDERRNATEEEMNYLSKVFSRSGFTDAYYTGLVSGSMLGIRTEADKANSITANAFIQKNIDKNQPRNYQYPERKIRPYEYFPLAPVGHRSKLKYGVFYEPEQYTSAAQKFFDLSFIPLEKYEYASKIGKAPKGITLPPVITDSERDKIFNMLKRAKSLGASEALIHNIGHLDYVKDAGFGLHGSFRLNIVNNETARVMDELGFCDYVLSPELTLPRIRDIKGPSLSITYGKIPLMITEKCIGSTCGGCKKCEKDYLIDRKGIKFNLMRVYDHRSEILNCVPIYMADRTNDLSEAGIISEMYLFTSEKPYEVDKVLKACSNNMPYPLSKNVRRIQKK